MTREGGRCGGRGVNNDISFEKVERAQLAQLEERYVSYGIYNSRTYYNPRWEERDYHVPSYNVSKPIDYSCDKDKDNDLNEIDNLCTDYSTRKEKDNEIPNFYPVKENGKEDINEFKIGESFIDLSAPAIYDDYGDDVFIYKKEKDDETEIGHEDFGEQNPCRKINFNPLPKSNDFNGSINSSKDEIRKYRFNDFERYDFLGIEQILSKSCIEKVLIHYLKTVREKCRGQILWSWWSATIKDFEYSKYLFQWRGGLQYYSKSTIQIRGRILFNLRRMMTHDILGHKAIHNNDPSGSTKRNSGPWIKINQGLIIALFSLLFYFLVISYYYLNFN